MEIPVYLDSTQNTEEAIRQRMLDRVDDDIDKTEGSYVWDGLAPVAMELVFVSLLAQYVLNMGFAQTSADDYLTMRAAEHGVIIRPAVKATGKVLFTGTPGSTVPEGLLLSTEGAETEDSSSLQFVTTQNITLDETGHGEAAIEAVEAGAQGNIPAGRIVLMLADRRNVQAVTNPEPTTGGLDVEDPEILRARYLEKVRHPGTSGNIDDYKQWAKEVPGVTDVHVIPLWNGPGTVKLIVLGPNKLPPDAALVAAVQEYIAPTNGGERKAPIGATVAVDAAESLPIQIDATVLMDASANISLAEINENFTADLTEYLATMAFQADVIRYARIGSLLIEQTGVVDYIDLTINGGTGNIPVANNQVAVVGAVEIHV
ncbi:baseplate J/gp47 family protein [Propionispora vibrioides]|uniref:Uncharacterized phage protein gp47/JayE n=1 Tax=Propionispora vibrioides TaxID=112903 RepID=A0A1H8U654_9FIRM|nr:baseplate J/gp47 family protein [Propionispora vibrioides]SEO98740.1 Uncharacterized phage protein gp47/JayE [Propionispora vibrioides]